MWPSRQPLRKSHRLAVEPGTACKGTLRKAHKQMKRTRRPPNRSPQREPREKVLRTFLPHAIGVTGGVALAVAAFWFFKRQADQVVGGRTEEYDTLLLQTAHSLASPDADRIMRYATYLGTHVCVGTIAGLTAVTLVRRGRGQDAWTVLISTGGAIGVNTALKNMFQRPRPQELRRLIKLPKSHSFPSGHSLLAAATFPVIAHHLVESRGPMAQFAAHSAAVITILGVGSSRVYFGVHFPSDVFAGFAAGLGWLGVTSLSHTLIDRDRSRARALRKLQSVSSVEI